MFSYCAMRGYCEMHGIELHTDPWWGERVFQLEHPRCEGDLPRRDENTLCIGERNVSYRSYSQRQHCADYYSLRQIRQWFMFRPVICSLLPRPETTDTVVHFRRGDYAGSGYPVVSADSYLSATPFSIECVTEESPRTHKNFLGEFSFVPDFYFMANAHKLYRANSSFSFWAGCLAIANHSAQVYSPIITGKAGGQEHFCQFQPDNWARIAELDCVEQITIKP